MRRRQFLQCISASVLPVVHPAVAAHSHAEPRSPALSKASATTATGEDGLFFRPRHAWVGDVFPFYKDGKFRIFFQPVWRDPAHLPPGEQLYWPGSWYQTTTTDFVHFTECQPALPAGTVEQQDYSCFAGSVVEAENRFHIFYAGNNRYFPRQGRPANAVMHAVSQDLVHWSKVPADTFYASTGAYELNDWRDPFVFWNKDAGQYWMLVTARLTVGSPRRRGCLALCTSTDLKKWETRPPFLAPNLYYDMECPSLFRMGDWWYLLYSEFSEEHRTHYRMSRRMDGPWLVPDVDSFDGRALYAAKTASDGRRRFLLGWCPTRYDHIDHAHWNLDGGFTPRKAYPADRMIGPSGWDWGGNLVVHELMQNADGTLSVKIPEPVNAAFSAAVPPGFRQGAGDGEPAKDTVLLRAPGEFACSLADFMPSQCKIEALVTFEDRTQGCGVALRMSDDAESGYYIRLEPPRNRVVFDEWPRSGDIPFEAGLERALNLRSGQPVKMTVLVAGTMCVVYVDDRVALSTRLYDMKRGRWGVFVKEGSAVFRNLRLSGLG